MTTLTIRVLVSKPGLGCLRRESGMGKEPSTP